MIGSTIVSSPQDGLDKLGRHARGVLILLAVVQLASLAFLWVAGVRLATLDVAVGGGIGAAFLGLAVWARKQPMPPIVIGLIVYLAGIGLAASIEPSTLFQGVLFKGIVLVMFYNGIATARTHEKMRLDIERGDLR